MKRIFIAFFSTVLFLFSIFPVKASGLLQEIKERGHLNCGIYDTGNIKQSENIEMLMCNSVAIAIFNDKAAVNYIPLIDDARWDALAAKDADILYASPSWTIHRDLSMNINFSPVHLFDSLILLTLKSYGLTSAETASDNTNICVVGNPVLVEPLKTYINNHNKKLKIVELSSSKNVIRSLYHGKCMMMAEESDIVKTMIERSDEVIPLDTISTQPISAVVRTEDNDLYKIVSWLILGIIRAEEKGINSHNVEQIKNYTHDKEILFMLGKIPGIGEKLGISDEWLYRIIKTYGNYSEILQKTMGKNSRVYLLQKKLNSLRQDGGMFFSYPLYQ